VKQLPRARITSASRSEPRLSRLRDLHYTLRDAPDAPDHLRDSIEPHSTSGELLAAINAGIARDSRLKTPRQLIDWYTSPAPRLSWRASRPTWAAAGSARLGNSRSSAGAAAPSP